jgi:AcrR family transcriptional regulator
MPTPDRTSVDEIVQAGRDILESDGLAGLTMQAVAGRVGVRPPSLYKRVRNRDDLIGLITEATIRELADQLAAIQSGGDARTDLAAMGHTLRAFAHSRPAGFGLIFARQGDQALASFSAAPVLRAAATLAGEEHALPAARTITAWAYGFISMELAGAFNLGGDVDQAFEFGISRLAEALGER